MKLPFKSLASRFGPKAVTAPVRIYETWARIIARGLQFLFAIIMVGLYGHRVDHDRRHQNAQSSEWVYAVTVGGLSCITCAIFAIPIPFLRTYRLFAWDLILFVLWIAAFGTFGRIYIPMKTDDKAFEGTSTRTMKAAVWLDLLNAIFWLATGLYGLFRTFVSNKADKKMAEVQGKLENKFEEKMAQIV